jgi:glutamyl-tRNA reductase
VRPGLAARGDRPLCILDIAMPRDVDPAVGKLANVFLYDLDDLQAVVQANLERRRAELPSAEELIGGEVGKYWDWVAGLSAVPVLTEMRASAEALRTREVADALRRLQHLGPADQAAIEELSKTLMNKFLHAPSVRLRQAAANGRGLGVVDTARYLFDLERGDASSAEPLSPSETSE